MIEHLWLKSRWQRLLKAAEAFVAIATGRSTVVILMPVQYAKPRPRWSADPEFKVEDPRFTRDKTLN